MSCPPEQEPAVQAPAEFYELDADAISYRIGGQRRYGLDAHTFVPAAELTAGRAKQHACCEHGDHQT